MMVVPVPGAFIATPEVSRRALYARLEEVLGNEHADTLMTYLPTQPWEELATKADIRLLEERFDRLEARFDRLEDRFHDLHGAMRDQMRMYTVTTVGSMTALTAIFALMLTIIH